MMLLVGLGGFLGAISRVFLGEKISGLYQKNFPFSTLIINVTGAFLLGVVWQAYQQQLVNQWVWLLCGTGFLGAFTTFSTFSVEAVTLCLDQQIKKGVIYVVSSVILGIIGVYLGMKII